MKTRSEPLRYIWPPDPVLASYKIDDMVNPVDEYRTMDRDEAIYALEQNGYVVVPKARVAALPAAVASIDLFDRSMEDTRDFDVRGFLYASLRRSIAEGAGAAMRAAGGVLFRHGVPPVSFPGDRRFWGVAAVKIIVPTEEENMEALRASGVRDVQLSRSSSWTPSQ